MIAEISEGRSLLTLRAGGAVLAAVLRGFGVNLPLAANGLTPAFSLLGLLVGAAMIRKIELRAGVSHIDGCHSYSFCVAR